MKEKGEQMSVLWVIAIVVAVCVLSFLYAITPKS